jgi:hypothetical protein
MGAAEPETRTMTDRFSPDHEPRHAASATASLLTELQLYGHRPFQDEPDTRPLPDASQVGTALADIFDALVATLTDTRLEPDLEDLLWSTVNLFHRAADRIERELDGNEQAQRRSHKEQDGSEVRSVELERLLTTPEECDIWMTAPIPEALELQRPLADGLLSVVARGEKQDPPASSPERAPALLL